jgi:transposase-like protein
MIKAVKKDTGNVIYMRFKTHACPTCQSQLKVVKLTKVVKAKTKEAKNFDFTACDASLGQKVKFIWYEFKCKNCDKTYTEAEMKAIEKAEKKAQKAEAKAEKKAEKKAQKAEARAEKKSAENE